MTSCASASDATPAVGIQSDRLAAPLEPAVCAAAASSYHARAPSTLKSLQVDSCPTTSSPAQLAEVDTPTAGTIVQVGLQHSAAQRSAAAVRRLLQVCMHSLDCRTAVLVCSCLSAAHGLLIRMDGRASAPLRPAAAAHARRRSCRLVAAKIELRIRRRLHGHHRAESAATQADTRSRVCISSGDAVSGSSLALRL